jgi:hypothetical protein
VRLDGVGYGGVRRELPRTRVSSSLRQTRLLAVPTMGA